jgi:hypothetical protein
MMWKCNKEEAPCDNYDLLLCDNMGCMALGYYHNERYIVFQSPAFFDPDSVEYWLYIKDLGKFPFSGKKVITNDECVSKLLNEEK